jgi:hypothetical protein
MQDKRRHKRYRLDLMEVNGRMSLADKVEIIDISIGGVALTADRRLNPGREYVLRLGDKWKSIEVIGVVVRSALSGFEQRSDGEQVAVYTAGMKFKDSSTTAISDFLVSIEHTKKEILSALPDRRCSVRFKITVPGEKVLTFPANFRVIEISLSGFRIDTDMRLERESIIPMVLSLHNDEEVNFNGRVASCLKVGKQEEEAYEIGVEFLDVKESDRSLLRTFIDYLAEMEKNGGGIRR